MNPVGDLGLLKMDFLGLKTLSVIRNCCDMIHRTKGIEFDMDRLPLDDATTYDLLNKGNTVGVFQLESGGMRDLWQVSDCLGRAYYSTGLLTDLGRWI